MAKRKRHDDLMLLAPGELVKGSEASYAVEKVVGTGAFGAVYFARDPAKEGRKVALKEFFGAKHPREQAMLKDLFERERIVGKTASQHPLMPTFYEAFTFDSHFYIAQEFIEGTTLDEIIRKRSPLSREWTIKWSVCLCDALAYLHSCGIIHHDLKPANIRISPQGHLTLIDFGAAQYFGKAAENVKPMELYGTEGYLPPELDGDGKWVADVRTDIFALGCILYEMISGQSPDQDQINDRSMYVTNSLMQKPNADMNLISLINRALSYNTEYRFANTNEFLLELRKIAPPILLIGQKHIRFGDVPVGKHVVPIPIRLYNAGGGELQGEIRPREPWIQVPTTTFRANTREVNVIINPAKVPVRDQVVTGKLEINSRDIVDETGRVVTQGDRWFIECSVRLILSHGYLQVAERPRNDSPPITMTARKGQQAIGTFELKNVEQRPVDYKVDIDPGPIGAPSPIREATFEPKTGTVEGGQSVVVTITVPTGNLIPGICKENLVVKTNANQSIIVPVAVNVQSQLDFLKSKVLGR